MSAGNKSEEAGLYFAAWVTCLNRHEPVCPCIPPQLTSPRLRFTRWESLPLVSISPYSLCRSVFFFLSMPDLRVYLIPYLSPMLLLFICLQNECIYALDKLWNTEGINHCHLAAQHVSCRRSRLPILLLLSLTLMHFQLLQYINLRDGEQVREEGGVLDEDKCSGASAIWVKYMFTHSQLRNPGAQCQISYSGCPGSAAHPPPPTTGLLSVADFCNSYLDEWLKLRRSQQESHRSYLRKNGQAVIFWCIACHSACKQDALPPQSLPSFRMYPKRPSLVIDQVLLWHRWRHVGSLPTQQSRQKHSAMLIWCDQNKDEGRITPNSWSMASKVWLLRGKPSKGLDKT